MPRYFRDKDEKKKKDPKQDWGKCQLKKQLTISAREADRRALAEMATWTAAKEQAMAKKSTKKL